MTCLLNRASQIGQRWSFIVKGTKSTISLYLSNFPNYILKYLFNGAQVYFPLPLFCVLHFLAFPPFISLDGSPKLSSTQSRDRAPYFHILCSKGPCPRLAYWAVQWGPKQTEQHGSWSFEKGGKSLSAHKSALYKSHAITTCHSLTRLALLLRYCHKRVHRRGSSSSLAALPSKVLNIGRRVCSRGFRARTFPRRPHVQLLLLLLIPHRQALEESKGLLRSFIQRHLMLELASRLGECASTLVNPHIAVHFVSLRCRRACGDDAVDLVLEA